MVDQARAAAPATIYNPNLVLAAPAPTLPVATEWQQDQPDEMDVFQPAGEAAEQSVPAIFRYGPLVVRPHADYQFIYGTGIQYTPGAQQNMVIQDLSPGILLDIGRHWTVDYTPMFQFYSSDKFRDSVNHAISLTGDATYEDWVFGLTHNTQLLSMPTVETGTQTDQAVHSTAFSASRELNSKLSLDLGLNQNISLVSGLEDSYDWSTLDWLNYIFWPRLNAGIGVGGGYVLVQGDNAAVGTGDLDQSYEQVQARVNWRATEKISFQINAGFEDRQFMSAGAGSSLDPIFGATIQYQPFQYTQIAINGSRTVSSSDYYIIAQEVQTTVASVSLTQRLLKKFSLAVGAAYSVTDYSTAAGGFAGALVNRTDDQVSFNARLSHPFFKRGTWSIFYQYANNSSTLDGFTFDSNQSGFEINYSF